jgi:hypothetical protein
MHGGNTTGIEPVAGEIERRTIAVFKAENLTIEVLGAFEVLGLDGVVL